LKSFHLGSRPNCMTGFFSSRGDFIEITHANPRRRGKS
jgi:hypothetical protein